MLFKALKKVSTLIATTTLLGAISSLSTILLLSTQANAAELTVNIKNINKMQGHLMLAMFKNEESYKQGDAVKSAKIKVTKNQEKIVFSNIVEGEYAIKLIQDENDNNKFDTNMLGIPKEAYGFSNNGGQFGQPDYKDAKFNVKDNTAIDINLF